jgi:lysozyme
MTDYLLGIDVSKWQGEMNWQTAADAGAKFAFIRAGSIDNSSGYCYTDYHYMRNISLAPDHMPVGCYWYFRPNHSPTKQANYFCDLLEGEDWKLPPVLDLETTGGLSPVAVSNESGEFIAQVYQRTKYWPIVYSRSYFLHDRTIDHPLFHECDLWIARYTSKPEPWGNPGDYQKAKPPYWDDWTFWQWIADSNLAVEFGGEGPPGSEDDIDLNYFNGDEEDLQEYIGSPFPPTPVLPPNIGVKVNIEIDGQDVKYQGHIDLVE